MANSSGERIGYAMAYLNSQHNESVAGRIAASDMQTALANARQAQIARVTPNVQSDTPADRDAVETALAWSSADVGKITMDRELIRTNVATNVLDEIETINGEGLNRRAVEEMGATAGVELDKGALGKLADANYAAVAGAINVDPYTGQDNLIQMAANAAIARAWPFTPGGTAAQRKTAFMTLKNVSSLLWQKRAVGPVMNVGGGQRARIILVCPLSIGSWIAHVIAENWGGTGDGQVGSFGRQALEDIGIFGSDSYVGRVFNMDVVTSTQLPTAAAAADHFAYAVPVGTGAFQVATRMPMIAQRRFMDGNTGGAAVNITDGLQAWGATVAKPGHVVRVDFSGS